MDEKGDRRRKTIRQKVPEYARFEGIDINIETKRELFQMSAADREENGIR